jgi:hypothetical protein
MSQSATTSHMLPLGEGQKKRLTSGDLCLEYGDA